MSASSMPGPRPAAILAGLLVALALTPVLGHRYVWEEKALLGLPKPYHQLQNLPTLLWGESHELERIGVHRDWYVSYYRPLTLAANALLSTACGKDPFPVAALTILLHALAAGLWTLWVARAFGDSTLAVMAGLVWGLHPIAMSSAAWVGFRPDVPVALSMLVGLNLALTAPPRIFAQVLLFALALGFKEMAVVFPALLAVLHLYGFFPPVRWREALAYVAGCGVVSALYLVLRARALTPSGRSWASPSEYLAQLGERAVELGLIVKSFLWPEGLGTFTYASELARLKRSTGLTLPGAVAGNALLVLAGLAAAVLAWRLARGAARIGLLVIFVTMLPLLKLVPTVPHPFILSERHLYLPSMGMALLVALGLRRMATTPPRAILAATILIVWASFGQVRRASFATDSQYYTFELESAPEAHMLHACLGYDLVQAGMLEQGVAAYGRSLELEPAQSGLREERIRAQMRLSSSAGVRDDFLALANQDPHHVLHRPVLLRYLQAAGHPDLAREWLEKALPHGPDDADLQEAAAELYTAWGERDRAEVARARAASLRASGVRPPSH